MAKMKTHKGLTKRVKITGTGKVVRRKAGSGHLLSDKTGKRRRQLRSSVVIEGQVARARRKRRVLKAARGYRGGRSKLYRTAMNALTRAGQYAYRDRRSRKRSFRSLWITRITAACRERGTRYSLFIAGIKQANVDLNRKMLSEIAILDPAAFDALVALAGKHGARAVA
jgi:large subunit ribosomal protein L20